MKHRRVLKSRPMIPGFEKIVEQRIQKAREEGQFDNLPGSSKPIKFEEYHGPDELKLSYKILKNAGFLPPEIELKKKIHQTEQLLEAVQNNSHQKDKLETRLSYLLAKLDSVRTEQRGFSLLGQTYGKAIKKKLL